MARPEGTRNPGYEERRAELARAAAMCLTQDPNASLRALSRSADVSVPTMRHYFGDRDGIIAAALASMNQLGQPYIQALRSPERGDVRASLADALERLAMAWVELGIGRFYDRGLTASIGHPALGPAYVNEMLEPLLQAFEARLEAHRSWDELKPEPASRYLALALLSPIILGLLHQDSLGGRACRPLDMKDLIQTHVDAFLTLHGA